MYIVTIHPYYGVMNINIHFSSFLAQHEIDIKEYDKIILFKICASSYAWIFERHGKSTTPFALVEIVP